MPSYIWNSVSKKAPDYQIITNVCFCWHGWDVCCLDKLVRAYFRMLSVVIINEGNIFRVKGPFVRWIHRSPVSSPHKGQWRGALIFSLICAWINGWVNNREAGELRRHRVHYDVIVMGTAVLTEHVSIIVVFGMIVWISVDEKSRLLLS